MHPCYAHAVPMASALSRYRPTHTNCTCNQIDLRSAGERSRVRRLAFEPPPNDKEDKDKGCSTT